MRSVIMGCDENYVDPLDPAPKSKETVSRPEVEKGRKNSVTSEGGQLPEVPRKRAPSARKHAPSALRPPKTRAPGAWPSSQECVGRHASDRRSNRRISFEGSVTGGQKISQDLPRQTVLAPIGNSMSGKIPRGRGRLWSDVVAGRNRPRGKKQGSISR